MEARGSAAADVEVRGRGDGTGSGRLLTGSGAEEDGEPTWNAEDGGGLLGGVGEGWRRWIRLPPHRIQRWGGRHVDMEAWGRVEAGVEARRRGGGDGSDRLLIGSGVREDGAAAWSTKEAGVEMRSS